ncbi:tetratricopeptide repeat protein [Lacinutrix cladophorae]
MKEEDYILFENYLAGELAVEEKALFEDRLETDAAFQESFKTYKAVSGFLEHKFENEATTNAFKSNLKSISNAHFNVTKNTSEENKKTNPFRILKYAIAACVVLMFSIFTFNQFNNPTYSDYNSHEPMTVVRGNVKDLIEATKAFNNEEYEKANSLLKKVLENDPENTEIQLYYAITNIELDNFNVADTELNKIITGKSAYKDKAFWYAALSRLKQRKIDATIVLLKQVSEESDDYKEAQKLLNKLE